ncbi:hypothetical protein QRD89_12035 [Halobacillus sp. ACCC02827]|uniref:hypothetical protein n=1 Tax=Bacillaceae TaxID=186817 RepID=UPI0002A5168F|nr:MULTISPECIES: hypothetical protein [Bacillaceae]ELK45507.1 hypothetical protein D479_14662 [Halobacillus sp. BAB-2008]QHT47213.1 hypothetical protein M662_12190 [Bacillus sp. SB49]WJE14446.1 hypothetical protein QRD89_12035 [Halobacillus sp. ACCC02827]
MKAILAVILIAASFLFGALTGIDRNNLKEPEEKIVTSEQAESASAVSSAGLSCEVGPQETDIPWIAKLAGAIGEGVAICFHAVILVFSGIIQSG